MTPTELNQLPEPQQRNALLSIARGYPIDREHITIDHPTDFRQKAVVYLWDWQPEQDGALMWGLVCELRKPIDSILAFHDFFTATENASALIAAYIAADPKGLIAKWRKDNE